MHAWEKVLHSDSIFILSRYTFSYLSDLDKAMRRALAICRSMESTLETDESDIKVNIVFYLFIQFSINETTITTGKYLYNVILIKEFTLLSL